MSEQLTLDQEETPRTFRVVMGDPGSRWALGLDEDGNPGAPRLEDSSDASLARLAIVYRRELEDVAANVSRRQERWIVEYRIARVRSIQLSRFGLRMRYGARDATDGATHNYDHYCRLRKPPSYKLAAVLDRYRWCRGMEHVLAWGGPYPPRRPMWRRGLLP